MKKFAIVSFGKIDQEIIEYLESQIKKSLKINTEYLKEIPTPWTKQRQQQSKAADFLLAITGLGENLKYLGIIGLTEKDLYMPKMNFVFGLAAPREKVAVVSLARLKTDKKRLYFDRLKKEVFHELGHLLGLNHCPEKNCTMKFSQNLTEVDAKEKDFCPVCRSHFVIY